MLEVNKIHLGDSYKLIKEIPDKSVDLVVIDPPYNIGIAEWDKIDNYTEWMGAFFLEFQRVLKDNGSMYFWHSDMNQASQLMEWLRNNTDFIFNSFIVWDKSINFRNNAWSNPSADNSLRSWFNTAEYCFYYTMQNVNGGSKYKQNIVYSTRDYIRNEIVKAKGQISLVDINTILGTATNGGGVASACLSLDKAEPMMITKEHYIKLQNWLNNGREYEYLKREYEDLRYSHNVIEEHNNVWKTTDGNNRDFHICEKPLQFIQRIIKCSSNEGDLILDCFSGSGTTCVAAKELNRRFIGIEIDENYHRISVERLNGITTSGQTSIFTDFEQQDIFMMDIPK